MKKKIRSSVFETNSSSMHTLTLKSSDETKDFVLELDKDEYLHIETGDYSDLQKDLKEVHEILSFVASWLVEYGYYNGWGAEHDYEGNPSSEEMRSFKGFDILENIVKKYTGAKGIIIEEIKKLEFPSGESLNIKEEKMLDPDVMEQLIFGKGSYVEKWWWIPNNGFLNNIGTFVIVYFTWFFTRFWKKSILLFFKWNSKWKLN